MSCGDPTFTDATGLAGATLGGRLLWSVALRPPMSLSFPTIVGRRRALAGAAPTGFLLATGAGGWLGKGIDVGRWVVGDDKVVIENVAGGRISVHIPSGEPLVGGWEVIEDLAIKITAAMLIYAGEADRVEEFQGLVTALSKARRIGPGATTAVGAADPDLAAPTGRPRQPGG